MHIRTQAPIDFAYSESGYRVARSAFESRFPGVRLNLVDRQGMGGGWPTVTLEGERDLVENALRVAWDTGVPSENDWLVDLLLP